MHSGGSGQLPPDTAFDVVQLYCTQKNPATIAYFPVYSKPDTRKLSLPSETTAIRGRQLMFGVGNCGKRNNRRLNIRGHSDCLNFRILGTSEEGKCHLLPQINRVRKQQAMRLCHIIARTAFYPLELIGNTCPIPCGKTVVVIRIRAAGTSVK